jgi:hypothetical protein
MNIKDKKERISDVMAIYIVRPTEENFKLIKSDLQKRNFDNFYINFVEKCEDSVLQNFYSDLLQTDNHSRIYKITITPIGIFLLHQKLFSLNIPSPYLFLNNPNSKESEINSYFDKVGTGIFNALFTLKTIPIIKYRTGWFAENIINTVQQNFKETFDKFPELLEEFPKKNNTLLVILDRDTDLPVMFNHSASLGSMYNDNFGIIRSKASSSSIKFEIDPLTDHIWTNYMSTNFAVVEEKIHEESNAIRDKLKFLDEGKNSRDDIEQMSEKLSSTIEELRDLKMKQTVLSYHASFLTKLSTELGNRRIAQFYELEELMLNKRMITKEIKQKFYDIITLKSIQIQDINQSKSDLLRICIIYYLINTKITSDEIKEIERALGNIGQGLDSFDYLKQKRSFEESMKKGKSVQDSGFLSKSFSFVVNRLGSLMSIEQPSIVADLLSSLAGNKEVPNFVTCHTLKKVAEKSNYNFNQVIVFMVGGGSLVEFEYVDNLLKKNDIGVKKIFLCFLYFR